MGQTSNAVIRKATEMLGTIGRSGLAAAFPNDFEVYLCALELTDSENNTIDFFTFPINPSSIQKVEAKRETARNTAGGVTILSSPTFVPQEINIRGDFGRTFKILLSVSGGSSSILGSAFSLAAGKYSLTDITGKGTSGLKAPSFDPGVKTGFGCTKMMQAIISKSNGVDKQGLPFKLFFYNMALGESYLVIVPPSGLALNQNMQKNMILEYNLNMTAISPMASVKSGGAKTSLIKTLTAGAVQKGVNDLAAIVAGML